MEPIKHKVYFADGPLQGTYQLLDIDVQEVNAVDTKGAIPRCRYVIVAGVAYLKGTKP